MVQAREEMGRAREEAGRAMQWAGTEPDICQALEKWMMGMEEWVQAVGKKEEQAVAVMQAILKRLGAVEAGLVRSQGMQRRGTQQRWEAEQVQGCANLAAGLAALVQAADRLPAGHRRRDGYRVTD